MWLYRAVHVRTLPSSLVGFFLANGKFQNRIVNATTYVVQFPNCVRYLACSRSGNSLALAVPKWRVGSATAPLWFSSC